MYNVEWVRKDETKGQTKGKTVGAAYGATAGVVGGGVAAASYVSAAIAWVCLNPSRVRVVCTRVKSVVQSRINEVVPWSLSL